GTPTNVTDSEYPLARPANDGPRSRRGAELGAQGPAPPVRRPARDFASISTKSTLGCAPAPTGLAERQLLQSKHPPCARAAIDAIVAWVEQGIAPPANHTIARPQGASASDLANLCSLE